MAHQTDNSKFEFFWNNTAGYTACWFCGMDCDPPVDVVLYDRGQGAMLCDRCGTQHRPEMQARLEAWRKSPEREVCIASQENYASGDWQSYFDPA